MEINTLRTQNNNILKIQDDFVSLLNSSAGFLYAIRYRVDFVKAVKTNATKIKISVFNRFPGERGDSLFSDENLSEVDKILLRQSICKDKIRTNPNLILSIISDFSNKIDNSIAQLFSSLEDPKSILPTSKKVSLKEKNSVVASPLLGLSSAPEPVSNPPDTQTTASNSLLKDHKDPFDADGIERELVNATQNLGGSLTNDNPPAAGSNEQIILSNITGGGKINPTSSSQLLESTLIPILVREITEEIGILEIINIPRNQLYIINESNIYVKFDLLNNKNQIIQTITKKIPHSKIVVSLSAPIEPPLLTGQVVKLGENLITINQIDPMADSAFIYRKPVFLSTTQFKNAQYEFVEKITTTSVQDTFYYRDKTNNSVPIIYRIIPAQGEKQGIKFSSIYIPRSKLDGQPMEDAFNNLSITANSEQSGIFVEINNIPVDVISIILYRKNLTIHEQSLSPLSNGLVLIQGNKSVEILDENVKFGHIYEYKCKFIYSSGSEMFSSGVAIEEYEKVEQENVNVQISNISPEQNLADAPNVSFQIDVSVESENNDILKNRLEKQNIDEFYTDEIKKEREKLNGIITHSLIRKDLTTGNVDDFGIISEKKLDKDITETSETFSDARLRDAVGAAALEMNKNYKYEIISRVNDPETIFQNFIKTITNETTNQSYSFSPSKFLHAQVLKNGTLFSTQDAGSISAKNIFNNGKIVARTFVSVDGNFEDAQIISANVKPTGRILRGKKTNMIEWQISGNNKSIDHFIIVANLLGQSKVVGQVHNDGIDNYYEFQDIRSNNDIGEIFYNIIPIFNDFSQGTTFATNKVVI